MLRKNAGRYLRFSSEDQSANSTERQDIATGSWCQRHEVNIVATFSDEGHSARTFDRPDVQKLFDFIKKNHQQIDLLVVQDLSRFSREAGEAITMVKRIQLTYGVKIVSCDWNQVYDVTEANSYFMMLIEFGRATADNLFKINNTNGGIYAAKTTGRYIGARKPFGYTKMMDGKLCNIAINEEQRKAVEQIYKDFIEGVPVVDIRKFARKAGYTSEGKCAIQKLIANPVYKGYQHVKAWKDNAGGLHKGTWEPIIDAFTWEQANERLKGNKSKGISQSDTYYLKGVLHCYCARKVTAAPSKGKNRYYPYYKCNTSQHLNINADVAHAKMLEVLKYMSLSDRLAAAIREKTMEKMAVALSENKKQLSKHTMSLAKTRELLDSVESKFIADDLQPDSYKRWHHQYTVEIAGLELQIEELNKGDNYLYTLLENNLQRLTDIPFMFSHADTSQKQKFLNRVFNNSLYMQDKIYRTPYMMSVFQHNKMILKQKELLIIEEKRASVGKPVEGWLPGQLSNTMPFISLLSIVDSIKVAV